MTRRREEGYCAVYMMDGNGMYQLPRSQYARALSEWMKGAAFIATTGYHGDPVVIKASRIEAINDRSLESLTSERAEKDADDAEDIISGGV